MITALFPPLSHSPWLPLFIFLARVTDVSIGTVRLICVTRGRRAAAIFLGFFEVLIWVLAVSSVLAHLSQWVNILAWAGGFATGNAVGMWIEQRLALGMQMVTFLSKGKAQAVAERFRFGDMMVTTMQGSGRDGPVAVCFAVVPRKQTPTVIRMAKEIDPNVLVTVEDVRETSARQPATQLAGKVPTFLSLGTGWRRG
jgi:uncharacterized protein YebE (UPF0316 family)